MTLKTAELLALAVLKGDLQAVFPLIDSILEEHSKGGIPIQPVAKFSCSVDQIRIAIFLKDSAGAMTEERYLATENLAREWVRGGITTVSLAGVDRIELYELPPAEGKKT